MPAPAWPLIMSCLVSASNHIVVLRASSSSLLSQSLARSHIQAGSVTWASQSKVGKSFVIGANFWIGMLFLLCLVRIRVPFYGLDEHTSSSIMRGGASGQSCHY